MLDLEKMSQLDSISLHFCELVQMLVPFHCRNSMRQTDSMDMTYAADSTGYLSADRVCA